jgi:hypothetical protein
MVIQQAVHECMNTIVKQFPQEQQKDIQTAVDYWRYPYWDWALANSDTHLLDVPELMRLPTIQIQRPDGTTPTMDNPMYRYAFPLNKEQKIDGIDDVVESVDGKDFVVPVRPTSRILGTGHVAHIDLIYTVFANAFHRSSSHNVRPHDPVLGKCDMGARNQQ